MNVFRSRNFVTLKARIVKPGVMNLNNAATPKHFSLADISPVRKWNYSQPTLVQSGRFTARQPWTTSDTFWKAFLEKFPVFEKLDLKELAIGGGCIVDFLLSVDGRGPVTKDVDMFFVGKPSELAARVLRLMQDLIAFMDSVNEKKKRFNDRVYDCPSLRNSKPTAPVYDKSKVRVTKYRDVYTISVPCCSVPIQVKQVDSLDSFFESNDVSCTAVAYFEKELIFSEKAKQSIEDLAFTVNPSSIKANCQRIIKYFNKGFDLILPDLDVSAIPRRHLTLGSSEILDLPYFHIKVSEVKGNKISIRDIEIDAKAFTVQPSYAFVDYDGGSKNATMHAGAIIHENIRKLANGILDDFTFVGEGELFQNVFLSYPMITERMVINTYQTVKRKAFSSNEINLGYIEAYCGIKSIKEICSDLFDKYFETRGNSKAKILDNDFNEHVSRYLDKLFDEQIEAIKLKLIEMHESRNTKVVTAPADVKVAERITFADWYGRYLKK